MLGGIRRTLWYPAGVQVNRSSKRPFTLIIIHANISPVQYSYTVQNRGLKHTIDCCPFYHWPPAAATMSLIVCKLNVKTIILKYLHVRYKSS